MFIQLDGEFCDVAGIICLHKFAWPYISFELCECPFSCIDLKYSENSVHRRSWFVNYVLSNHKIKWRQFQFLYRIVGDLPFLQKASFRAEVITPKMRLKREIIFSFEGMIVSFGEYFWKNQKAFICQNVTHFYSQAALRRYF